MKIATIFRKKEKNSAGEKAKTASGDKIKDASARKAGKVSGDEGSASARKAEKVSGDDGSASARKAGNVSGDEGNASSRKTKNISGNEAGSVFAWKSGKVSENEKESVVNGKARSTAAGKIRRKLRRNRMVITAFAVMIAVAGYLNYAERIDSTRGGQTADLEAANAAADAVYEGDSLLSSEDDIASLDVDYDLVLSEDDLEEVTETETAGDKDGVSTGDGEETGTSEEGDGAKDSSGGESGADTDETANGTDAESISGETAGTGTAGADGETAGTDVADAGKDADGTETADASGTTAGTDADSNSDGADVADAGDTAEGTDAASSNIGESLFVSSTGVLTFVAEAKLSREQARAKSKETLLEIVSNDALSESAKQSAIEAMVELSNIASMEAATETLLAAKGFTNSVVTIQDDSVDVIVNAEQLSDSERAQIEDIITQKTGISVEYITIVPLRESEE